MLPDSDREGGFIVIQRRIQSSDLWRSLRGDQRAVFMTLLLLANWKPAKARWRDQWYEVKRGELSHSMSSIAEEANVGIKVVRTTIEALMADDRQVGGNGPAIVAKYPISGTGPGTGPRILTVVNYDKYQALSGEAGTGAGTDPARVGHGPGTDPAQREPFKPVEPSEQRSFCGKPSASPPPVEPAKAKKEKPTDPRHQPLTERLVASFLEVCGVKYGFGGGRDAKAVSELLRLSDGDLDEVDRRWRAGLSLGDKWPGCSTICGLPAKWNELAKVNGAKQLRAFQPITDSAKKFHEENAGKDLIL